MNQADQEVRARRGARFPLSLRFWGSIGLALAIGIWTSPDALALTVSPTAISFQAVQGGTNPPSQSLSVSKGNNKPTTWTATDSAGWLTVSPGAGSITSTAQMAMAVNTSGLAAGTYSATVTIIVVKGGSAVVPVTLTVAPATTTSSSTTPTTSSPPPGSTSFTDAQGVWVLTAGVLTLNGTTIPTSGALALRLCNGIVDVQGIDGQWYHYTSATASWAVASPCSSPPPPTSSSPTTSTSTTASLSWSPPTNSTGVAGYNVRMRTASGVYGPPINVGNVTSYVVNNLVIGNTYCFVVTAYNTSGVESAYSNEVSKSIY